MAKAIQFEALEIAWLKKALSTQRSALVRARQKEIEGSEIDELRKKEIQQIDALVARL